MLMTEFTRLTNKGQRQRHLGIRRQQPGKSCSHLIPIAGRMSIVALLKNKRVFQKSKIKNQKNQKIIENQKNCPGINHVRSVDFIIRSRTTFPFWSKTLFLIDMALHGFLSNFIGWWITSRRPRRQRVPINSYLQNWEKSTKSLFLSLCLSVSFSPSFFLIFISSRETVEKLGAATAAPRPPSNGCSGNYKVGFLSWPLKTPLCLNSIAINYSILQFD